MKRILGRLTYANVMATIAVFIALGGASYAAIKLPKNSVGAKQLKKGAVTEAKIKNGAISGAKLAKGAIGTVPAATHAATADSASTLGGQTAAQIAAASKLHCPAGTELAGGLCIETGSRPAADFEGADLKCAEVGRMLPTRSVLIASLLSKEAAGIRTSPEWTDDQISSTEANAMRVDSFPSGLALNFEVRKTTEPLAFRCATPPSN